MQFGESMGSDRVLGFELDRRRWLKLGVSSALGVKLTGTLLNAQFVAQRRAPSVPQNHEPSNGGTCPYPIPWLDKNGNHNQPAMPNVELSSIYHFKGKLARCSGFHGMGTTTKATDWLGHSTTDYSYMAGEYWAAREAQKGIFAHT